MYFQFAMFVGEASVQNIDILRTSQGTEPTAEVRSEIQRNMQNYAAVFRTGDVSGRGLGHKWAGFGS